VYNYPASTIHLSDLKGKLVILDFWSTWCGACIEAFPKMHRLQEEFGQQLQVILVNTFPHDDIKKVQSFFERRKALTGKSVELPYSLSQSSLPAYFPFAFIPHYVWINKSGKIIATTSQTEVTGQNIKNALAGNSAGMHDKQDRLDFSTTIPLFVNGNGGTGNEFLGRSIFTRYIEGIGSASGIERDDSGKLTRFYMFNNPPIMLLRAAYTEELNVPVNRILTETIHRSLFQPASAEGSLFYENSFCYDLAIPPSGIDELEHYLREDMERYLGITVKTETRKMNCLILRKGSTVYINSAGGEPGIDTNPEATRKYIQNEPFTTLPALLNTLPATKSIPVIDETNIAGKIDIVLPVDLYELPLTSLKAFLQKNGIEAVEMERIIKVAIIKDK
jgi:thiol-disulfide isomerase/thioredoxin